MKPISLYISPSNNPYYNLTLEDYLLKKWDTTATDLVFLYVNSPSVVVGRNQNLFEEVNLKYCKENNIIVSRRISGGGTVFHDEGNLNWCVFSNFDTKKVNNYKWAASYILLLLESYGLKPYLTKRNAIEIDKVKLSGQAQFTNRKNILSHGTLLVSSDLVYLQKAIEAENTENIQSKASKSVRSKTTNLNDFLAKKKNLDEIITDFSQMQKFKIIEQLDFDLDWSLFASNKWLYERSPVFTVKHLIEGKKLHFKVRKAFIEKVFNEKGYLVKDSLFENSSYVDFILNN